jgi:hypothetical protein
VCGGACLTGWWRLCFLFLSFLSVPLLRIYLPFPDLFRFLVRLRWLASGGVHFTYPLDASLLTSDVVVLVVIIVISSRLIVDRLAHSC